MPFTNSWQLENLGLGNERCHIFLGMLLGGGTRTIEIFSPIDPTPTSLEVHQLDRFAAMPTTSVIIPTHNRANLLPRAVESARAAGHDIEIVVVDDASQDKTIDICRRMPGIRYVRHEYNVGLASARNTGIAMSSGEYLAFLDDDDVLLPGSLDILKRALDDAPDAAFAYGRYWLGDSSCQPVGDLLPTEMVEGDIFWKLLEGNFIPVHTVLVRRRCVESEGGFCSHFPGVEDWHLWLRIAERYSVVCVDNPVAVYRAANIESEQMTSRMRQMCQVSMRVQRAAMRLPRARAASRRERRKARAAHMRRVSDLLILESAALLAKNLRRQARANLLFALRVRPLRAARPMTFRLLASSLGVN